MSKSVRLSDELFAEIERHAAVEHRSPPKQVEYLVKLGKILSGALGPEGALDVLQGFTQIRLEPGEPKAADMQSVLSRLEQDSTSGALAQKAATSGFRCGIDPTNPDKLVYVDEHGKQPLDVTRLPARAK